MPKKQNQPNGNQRRSFIKKAGVGALGASIAPHLVLGVEGQPIGENELLQKRIAPESFSRKYNGDYTGEYLDKIAFPIGGMGAGMFCLEGAGAISHMSIRHRPELYHQPNMFGAIVGIREARIERAVPKSWIKDCYRVPWPGFAWR